MVEGFVTRGALLGSHMTSALPPMVNHLALYSGLVKIRDIWTIEPI